MGMEHTDGEVVLTCESALCDPAASIAQALLARNYYPIHCLDVASYNSFIGY